MTSTIDMLKVSFGENTFVNETDGKRPLLALRTTKRFLVVIDREIIGPFVNRSTDPSDTIRYRDPSGKQLVRVPARKFKSKEKLRGLEICRSYGLVHQDYEYNAVAEKDYMNNPNSVLFGDTQTQGDAAGIPSKFIYGEGLSTDEVTKIAQPLTHNALSEEGTMWDRRTSSFRTSLFETFSILPGAHVLQTITVDSPTPEALAHLFMCLRATRYGAQTSVTGANIRNNVIAILATTDEPPVTAYTLANRLCGLATPPSNLDAFIKEELASSVGVLRTGGEARAIVQAVQSANDLEAIYQSLQAQASDFYKYVYESKGEGSKRAKKGARTGES